MGETKHSQRYCGQLAPSVNCLVHENAAPYYAYGLQQGGIKELMSLEVIKAGFRAAQSGFVPDKVVGDARMMPGTFIVNTQGIIEFAFYSTHAGEHAKFDDILAIAGKIRM
jgi:hypothetical protein